MHLAASTPARTRSSPPGAKVAVVRRPCRTSLREGATEVGTGTANQQNPPAADYSENDGDGTPVNFEQVGTATIAGDTLTVRIEMPPSDWVYADAIHIECSGSSGDTTGTTTGSPDPCDELAGNPVDITISSVGESVVPCDRNGSDI